MAAYYNENDPKAAAWLRELINGGHIAAGEVDERSIVDVRPDDLTGFAQCHFFAGIGGWSYALRLAGWPDDRVVWTGSCPCQPFSVAGKRAGNADVRHLWPEFARLIKVRYPAVVFGEQVASKDGRKWLAGVRLDLEGMGYGVGAADLCAAGVGAPHIRQRLYWVADAEHAERWPILAGHVADRDAGREEASSGLAACGAIGRLALADGGQSGDGELQRSGQHRQQSQNGSTSGMGNADKPGSQGCSERSDKHADQRSAWSASEPCGMADAGHERTGRPADAGQTQSGRAFSDVAGRGAWSDFDILACTDGKSRRVESGTFPLAHGVPARMGRLRGYGNAIVPQVAATFVEAYLSC